MSRFSIRVFCSTKKISKYLLHRHSFRRKYARNKNFTQKVEHQQLTFKKIFSTIQKAPFHDVILSISWPKIDYIAPWKRRKQMLKQALSEYQLHHSLLHCRVHKNLYGLNWPFYRHLKNFLTSLLRFYFVKKVKKIRESAIWVFYKSADMRR